MYKLVSYYSQLRLTNIKYIKSLFHHKIYHIILHYKLSICIKLVMYSTNYSTFILQYLYYLYMFIHEDIFVRIY
jgi:hypothetical protein